MLISFTELKFADFQGPDEHLPVTESSSKLSEIL